MREVWKSIRLAAYVIALPLAITAAVSAHQRLLDAQPIGTLTAKETSAAKAPVMAGTYRGHTLSVDDLGAVHGRLTTWIDGELSGLAKTRVILVREGAIAHLTKTSADGSFDVFGVEPGDYSFVATNGKHFATFGVRIVPVDAEVEAADVIEVATVDADSVAVVNILETQLPVEALAEMELTRSSTAVPTGANLVQIEDGRLTGRLFSLSELPLDNVTITLISAEDSQELTPQADGSFVVDNLSAGAYDFVAIGSAGFAVLRFEAIDSRDPVLAANSPMLFASTAGNPAPVVAAPALEVALTMPQDEGIVGEQLTFTQGDSTPSVMEGQPIGTDVGYGVAAGGTCGGYENWGGFGGGCGCGGFGGGGLAGLGRWAILGWILTKLFDEIDFSRPPPPSPGT